MTNEWPGKLFQNLLNNKSNELFKTIKGDN